MQQLMDTDADTHSQILGGSQGIPVEEGKDCVSQGCWSSATIGHSNWRDVNTATKHTQETYVREKN